MKWQLLFFLLLKPCVFCENTSPLEAEEEEVPKPPQPYTFGYQVKDKDGDQWRSEVSDGHGKVEGSYGYVDSDGMQREVHYVADDKGFRVRIKTNEPGMDVPNPADVVLQADPPADRDTSIYGVDGVQQDVRSNLVENNPEPVILAASKSEDQPLARPISRLVRWRPVSQSTNKVFRKQVPEAYSSPVSIRYHEEPKNLPVRLSYYEEPQSPLDETKYYERRPAPSTDLKYQTELRTRPASIRYHKEAQSHYAYHNRHAEPSAPPIYVVDGHLQSPWFPMDVASVS